MREEAAPGTHDGLWTHLVAHVVRDYVCPDWKVRHTLEGEAPDSVKKKDRNAAQCPRWKRRPVRVVVGQYDRHRAVS
jgi:hypothetical protein